MFQSIDGNYVTDLNSVSASYKMKHFHEHSYYELLCVFHGSCSLSIQTCADGLISTQSYKLDDGSVAIIPPNTPHKTIYLSNSMHERGIIYVNEAELLWINEELGIDYYTMLTSCMFLQIPERKVKYVRDIMEKICYEHKGVDNMSHSFVRAYFHTFLLFLLRCNEYNENVITKMDVNNQQIQDVIEYILNNFPYDITLSKTAELFNMSQSSLSKKFKTFTNQRFKEYLINVRTSAAANLLVSSDHSITEIANDCGFSDSNAFGDTFKRLYLMSPTEYRRVH